MAPMISNAAVALDGSAHARRAAALAGSVASNFGARAHLIYVMSRHEVPDEIKEFAALEHTQAGSVEVEVAHDTIVARVAASFREAGVAKVEGHVLTGNPVELILDYIKNHDINMIFTGRRGLGPIEGILLGSVSSRLSHLAECTVVTVK
jgi:nucleotide-binding universal stress UspA family protein